MRIPQISQAAYQNKNSSLVKQKHTHYKTDAVSNISFKMAYIDMDEAQKKNKLYEKYIADKHAFYIYKGKEAHPDKNESPVFYMDSKQLESACQELSQYPFLLKKMFLVQDRFGKLPAHHFDAEQLEIMVKSLKEALPDQSDEVLKKMYLVQDKSGKLPAHHFDAEQLETMVTSLKEFIPEQSGEVLKKIFNTRVSDGLLPAHYFKDPKSLSVMLEAVGEDEAVSILTKKDRYGFYPLNRYSRFPGMIYKTTEIMRNHKPELLKVLTHRAPTDEEITHIYRLGADVNIRERLSNGDFIDKDGKLHKKEELFIDSDDIIPSSIYFKKDDVDLICDIFKDSEDDLRRIFLPENSNGLNFIFACGGEEEEALYNHLRSKNYVNLLKDMYTCNLRGTVASDLDRINLLNILDLAANSDLDEKSSLEMLKINEKAFLRRYPLEYDTVVNELEEILEKKNR